MAPVVSADSGVPATPLVVGLTGGIGAGKSTLAGVLASNGADVIDVDAIGRAVIAAGGEAEQDVRARFGTTDRAELATIVFSDPQARAALESISWPAINHRIRELVSGSIAEIVILDMAVLAQGLGQGLYTYIITVEAPERVRLARLIERGMVPDDARARMAAQVSEAERRRLADLVVENADDLPGLEERAHRLWADLLALKQAGGSPDHPS